MGGYGSGRRDRHDKKETVNESIDITTKWLREQGLLKPNYQRNGSFSWTWGMGRTASIGYELRTRERIGWIRVRYTNTNRFTKETTDSDYAIGLKTTVPHYGGLRWWLICPLGCKRRVTGLYIPNYSDWFGCRHCHNLTYQSCQDSGKNDFFPSLFRGR